MKKDQRKYIIPALLVIVFALPGLAAIFLFQHQQFLAPAKTNRGELLNPPVKVDFGPQNTKWGLVYWSPGACDMSCEKQLDKLARIRLALGRRVYDVRVILMQGANASPLSASIGALLKDRDIEVMPIDKKQTSQLTSVYENPQVFIKNPTDFLVMAFSLKADPKDIHHDLKRLLNVKE